jgi:phosphopantothenoylcysteine synthetase/decarboxylase
LRKSAERKLKEKNLDMIITNNPSAIGADENDVDIKVLNKNWLKIKKQSKRAISERVIRIIENIRKPAVIG